MRCFGYDRRLRLQIFMAITIAFLPFQVGAETKAADLHSSPSIYHIDPWRDGAIIGATNLISLSAYANSESLIHERCPCDLNELNSLDRSVVGNKNDFFDHLSNVTVGAAMVFPIALDWYSVGLSREFAEDMVVYAETLSVNGALVTLAKYTTQRPLPRTYEGDARLINRPGGYRSFYSGHTSITFAALSSAAMTWTFRHEEDIWPWILTGVVGTSVGYERVLAGRHFYTDVLVGAAMGTALGVAIPRWHHQQKMKDQTVALMPTPGGIVGVWKMRF